VQAQGGGGNGDPAAMMARMKERLKPQLIEKVKLTDAQADKVVEINFDSNRQRRELRELPEGDRAKKLEELNADRNKKLAAIPLTAEQVKGVNDFFEEMRRNMPQRNSGGGGGRR
jgi:Spy/CpxP family protein refolding chaperone